MKISPRPQNFIFFGGSIVLLFFIYAYFQIPLYSFFLILASLATFVGHAKLGDIKVEADKLIILGKETKIADIQTMYLAHAWMNRRKQLNITTNSKHFEIFIWVYGKENIKQLVDYIKNHNATIYCDKSLEELN